MLLNKQTKKQVKPKRSAHKTYTSDRYKVKRESNLVTVALVSSLKLKRDRVYFMQ